MEHMHLRLLQKALSLKKYLNLKWDNKHIALSDPSNYYSSFLGVLRYITKNYNHKKTMKNYWWTLTNIGNNFQTIKS